MSSDTPENNPATTPGDADPLTPSEAESKELETLLDSGQRASNTIGALTVVGLFVLFVAFVIYHSDRTPGNTPFVETLNEFVHNQAVKDFRAARGLDDQKTPVWPISMYRHLRADAFIAAGLALALAVLFLLVERARGKRQALLVYRDLGREIERLRQRVKDLEDREKP